MKLNHSLVVFDLETTGTWIEKDKIVEIALIKILPDLSEETLHLYINPTIPIPPEVSELIGLKDQDVANAPKFKEVSKQIFDFIGDANVGGFNAERFDLPLLEREFREAGIHFDWRNRTCVDAQKVFHYHEKRDLKAAYQFYCDQDLDNAHTALADTKATWEVMKSQFKKYLSDQDSIESLSQFEYKVIGSFYDSGRKLRWWNGKLYPMFGKYAKKKSVEEIVKSDKSYAEWIVNSDFAKDVKVVFYNALNGKMPVMPKKEGIQNG